MVSRRTFLTGIAAAGVAISRPFRASPAMAQGDPLLAGRPLVRYPEKTDLILLTARPPRPSPFRCRPSTRCSRTGRGAR